MVVDRLPTFLSIPEYTPNLWGLSFTVADNVNQSLADLIVYAGWLLKRKEKRGRGRIDARLSQKKDIKSTYLNLSLFLLFF